ADQIAAGEVVERPASVVKELVENAIDAGATRISVEIRDGGQGSIRVADDGCGMSPRDAELCVQRHATSKIRSRDDLFSIATLGFRGEALPSIASVSRFNLLTRPRDADAGTRIQVDGGQRGPASEVGCAPGTLIEVSDLFYNVPARLKFLKSKPTESAHVAAICLRIALGYPEVALTLTRDGRVSQEFARTEHAHDRVAAAFPDETLRRYEAEFEGVRMSASLGAPERARSGSANLHVLVNNRAVRDMALARCVAYAYGSVLPPGRFPVGALFLELDPHELDVNVHPQKLEVRFARGRALYDALTRSLARKLGTSAWSGPAARGANYWQSRLQPSAASASWSEPGVAVPIDLEGPPPAAAAESAVDPWGLDGSATSTAPEPDRVAEPLLGARGFFSALRPLAQSRRMFLICEGETGLYVLDQHAADERVRFDQLRRAYRERSVKVQRLLFPERVECSELDAVLIERSQEQLAPLGLECTRLGPTTIAVAAVPALLYRASPARLIRDLLAELNRSGERAFADAIDMALATMACHGAIRAGDPLSPEEISALLRALDEVQDFQGHCPHGRPVVCTLAWGELERRLGR
ncbi:MAG TPA: DNA mismatch repair endonuclease MutL, partial [Polyangiales bacterium]|nr:DNA mismatch repair endonuclease MutL [Polyangiales bacterium]